MNDLLLLIPSAKLIPTELQAEFGPLPSAMIPLNNRPALAYILDGYREQYAAAIVAVDEGRDRIQEFLRRHEPKVRSHEVCAPRSLGHTLLEVLQGLRPQGAADLHGHLVINFADTLVRREVTRGDVVVYANTRESFRWTTFDTEDGRITGLLEKQHEKGYPRPNKVFVGVFEIARPGRFAELLERAVSAFSGDLDPFYLALQAYADERRAAGAPMRFEEAAEWFDFGHLDTYYAARRALSSGAREFNTVSIDARRGLIQKRSRHTTKLRNEISWYLNLPKNLRPFSPRIYEYSLDPQEPFVEMEYYGYPPLNDVYLHGAYGLGEWELILGAIDFFLQQAHEYRYEPSDPRELQSALRRMYEDKTLERLTLILEDARFARFHQPLWVNGRQIMGLRSFVETLPAVAARTGLYRAPYFTVLHGDLCLSNILFDRHNGAIRVIDPRGDFGGFDVYGDFRYDLAKLSHSIHGDYDFYVNGLFEMRETPEGFSFEPHLTERHRATKALFERWLRGRWPRQARQVHLIESLLFISMVPLHADRFASQQAFLARGLELYTRVVAELDLPDVGVRGVPRA